MDVFLGMNARVLPSISKGRARAEFDEIVSAIPLEAAACESATNASRSHTLRLRELRADLRVCHLAPIVAIARVKAPHTTLAAALRLPREGSPDYELIAVAKSAAKAIGADRRLFLQQQLPEDFVERMVIAADELQRGRDAAARSHDESVTATARIASLFRRGRELAGLLNTLVLSQLSHEPALAAAWRGASATRPARTSQQAASRTPLPD